jgi:hypothetical protein
MKPGEERMPPRPERRMLQKVWHRPAMQAPPHNHPEVVSLICGSLSGMLMAGLLLAAGLERVSLGVPQLLGAGEAPEPVAERQALR